MTHDTRVLCTTAKWEVDSMSVGHTSFTEVALSTVSYQTNNQVSRMHTKNKSHLFDINS